MLMLWFGGFILSMVIIIGGVGHQTWVLEWGLMSILPKMFNVVFIWDMYSFIFVITVLFISAMIFLFSYYYMDSETSRVGFILLLAVFVGSMIFLVLSPNLVMLLLGWDGLGLTSYLLVVYYSSGSSSVAGMVTFLTNRMGDILFLLSIGFMFFLYDWEISKNKSLLVLAFVMVLAFITKSAQVPFSSWLPAAMAAPTPVSSLVHSSTLVTAGVFLLIRFNSIVLVMSFFLFIVSVMTLLLAGGMANLEWDLKKLIAFSTLSQLGFMISTFSMGLVLMSFFHLITHALFKSSLFMSAGVVIHSGDNSQEFRNSFNLSNSKPFISAAMSVCLFCLSGIPLTSGFFSKDMIIDGGGSYWLFFILYMSGVFFTILYSVRFFVYTMKSVSMSKLKTLMVYEKVFYLALTIWCLVMAALGAGFFLFETVFSVCFFLSLNGGWKMIYFLVLSSLAALSIWAMGGNTPYILKQYFLGSMWFLNKLITSKISKFIMWGGEKVLFAHDGGILEKLGAQGLYSSSGSLGYYMSRLQNYVFFSFFFFFFYLFFMF